MRLDTLPVTLSLALLLSIDYARAAPSSPDQQQQRSTSGRSLHIPISRRAVAQRSDEELGIWAKQQKESLEGKYGGSSAPSTKRSTGFNMLVNQNLDSSYFGSIAVGTPPVAYDVILDTGSADLFLVSSSCTSQTCSGVQTFSGSSSSTFNSSTTPFTITYGSGSASGVLGRDVIQMAGFQVSQQTFALIDQLTDGLVTSPVSGILGLGWQALASSGATPFWQSLYEGNAWDEPLMGFYLTRFQNASRGSSEEPGGVFTMGTTNTSLYTGQIDYQNVQSLQNVLSYWTLPLTSLTVNSGSVTLPSGSSSLAAIDTGTTLIGGPAEQVAALYALIPGSSAGTGNLEGYYVYPCSTTVNVALSFGGQTWPISSDDMKLQQLSNSQCLGAVFTFSSGTSNSVGPAWIIGDTFLKNVYSVFRANPASIGFAQLAADAQSLVTQGGVPTPTIGSVSASVTGSGRSNSNAALPVTMPRLASLLLCAMGSISLFNFL